MNKYAYICLLMLFAIMARGQNMVPNGNFEQYSSCPASGDETSKCTGWRRYHQGTTDYFNACGTSDVGVPVNAFGFQSAASGKGYMGLYTGRTLDSTDYKEYMSRSITMLAKDVPYEVSMSVSLAEISQFGADGLGVWFYNIDPLFGGNASLPVVPQVLYPQAVTDKSSWVRLSQVFIPDSAYSSIVIGGFIPSPVMDTVTADGGNTDWCYYFIDSVVITKISRIKMNYKARPYCTGDTITVPFTLYGASFFNSSNIFSLQLSDPTGSFNSYTIVTSITGNSPDTLRYVVPSSGIIPGTGYRIRIVSDDIADTSFVSDSFAIGNVMPVKPIAGSNSPVCTGNTLYFTASGSTQGVKYVWSGPRGFTDTLQNPFIELATQSDSGKYIVTAWLYGCSAADTIDANVIHVIGVASNTVNDPVCANDSLKLSAHVIGQAVSYSWAGPNGFRSSSKDTALVHPSLSFSGRYVFTAQFKGCSSADTLEVSVIEPPATPDAGDDLVLCDGDTLKLRGNAATQSVNYNWTNPDGNVVAGQQYLLTSVPLSAAGNYICTASLAGCTSRDTVNVIVKPRPQVPDVSTNSPLKIGETLHMSLNNPVAGAYYTWAGPDQFSSSLLDAAINNVAKINEGYYYISASINGCASANVFYVAVDGYINPNAVIVFPNASNGNFTIRGALAIDEQIVISIINSNGQLVYEKSVQSANKLLNEHMQLKDVLSSGVYVLRLRIDGKVRSINLVINKGQ